MKKRKKLMHPNILSIKDHNTLSNISGGYKKYLIVLSVMLILIFLAYAPMLNHGFVWDDIKYIINNSLIRDISWKGLKAIFSNFTQGSYAPMTDVINALQYKISGLSSFAFHFGSLLFHLINIGLVFWFILLLCNNLEISIFTALLFGIHPLHVESVAWISGGSNLFCTAFFLGSIIAYIYFLKRKENVFLIFTMIFFLLAVLSKAIAVILPFVLLLVDYYITKKITVKNILQKAPFFIISLGIGVLTLVLKSQADSLTLLTVYPLPQRIIFATYGLISYFSKLVFPFTLSALYPYPVNSEGSIPQFYYIYPIIFAVLAILVYKFSRFSQKITFGVGFFMVTIILVLQLLPVGGAVMADRYSYIPSIGLFYLAGEALFLLKQKINSKFTTYIIFSVLILFYAGMTVKRCNVWENELTLWSDVINKFNMVPTAYANRGNAYANENKFEEALNDYNKAIELNPNYSMVYNNRGNILSKGNAFERAFADYTKAIELNPSYSEAYNNRGFALANENEYDRAILDYSKAIELTSNYHEAYYNRGIAYTRKGNYEQALDDYNKAIILSPLYVEAYINRGSILSKINRDEEALKDFNTAIQLRSDFHIGYFNRGILLMNHKRTNEALLDFNRAIELKPDYIQAHVNRGNLLYSENRYEDAMISYSNAIQLNPTSPIPIYYRGMSNYFLGKSDAAVPDLKKAADMGYKPAVDALSQIIR